MLMKESVDEATESMPGMGLEWENEGRPWALITGSSNRLKTHHTNTQGYIFFSLCSRNSYSRILPR